MISSCRLNFYIIKRQISKYKMSNKRHKIKEIKK